MTIENILKSNPVEINENGANKVGDIFRLFDIQQPSALNTLVVYNISRAWDADDKQKAELICEYLNSHRFSTQPNNKNKELEVEIILNNK